MPQIFIDGKRIEVDASKTVIQAAYDNGIDIPHFCWHPELSVSGNCRMCLVEVGMPKRMPDGSSELGSDGKPVVSYFPKLQIACATPVSEGMHILIKSKNAIEAQESVMEFLLINHPLDCPICDEAGQCKLQDYAFTHSKAESRFEEIKNHKDKRVSWGDTVLFDGERCISCSRCIRFSKEVAGQDVLSFVQRGDHVTIKLFEGTKLDNPYSMNVIDICPVGALTSKDFRFKSRVWDMSFNDSICPGCAKGCNIQLGVRNNEILRIEPKSNPYVNKFWMCDYGRLTQYQPVNDNRINSPILTENNQKTEVSWPEAITAASNLIKKYKPSEIMFIGSPKASNEDNFLLSKFAKKTLKCENIDYFNYIDQNFKDELLKVADKTPNAKGAAETGVTGFPHSVTISNLADKIAHSHIKLIYTLDNEILQFDEIKKVIQSVKTIIVHASNSNELTEIADLVLPCSTFAETDGTFVNIDSRVQLFESAITTDDNLRYMGMKMSRLDKFGAQNDRWTQHQSRKCKPSWKILQMIANNFGANWTYSNSEAVFDEITHSVESFKGMSYELLAEYQGLKLGKSHLPDKKLAKYNSHYLKPN